MSSIALAGCDQRQERVSKAVWGVLFITMGILFTLDNFGTIDMGSSWRFAASRAVDGDTATRWSSRFRDPQWIAIDLGDAAEITRVKLNWEAAHATRYQVQVSSDGSTWTTASEVTNGDGAIDDLQVSSNGRYVRMYGTARATPYGYSLWEFEVYGPSSSLLSHGKTAAASSTEPVSYWEIYWPMLLIAAGLPSLISPKDTGNQVMGLVLTGIGVAFQLGNLGLVTWGLKQALAVLFMLAGVMLVIQSLRQMNAKPKVDGASGDAGSLR